jgi:hypothetical protein
MPCTFLEANPELETNLLYRFRAALRALLNATNPYATSRAAPVDHSNSLECCICISPIAPFQALFVAPCSHCYHYKCISPILAQGLMFQCPLCRQVANLAAPVSTDEDAPDVDEELENELMAQMGLEPRPALQPQATFVEPPQPEVSVHEAPASPRREQVSSPETDGDEMDISDDVGAGTDLGEHDVQRRKTRSAQGAEPS